MDKFYRLETYLKNKIDDAFLLSFEDIERILGFKLTDSAYKYSAYWTPSETHTLPNMINDCGYSVTPNLEKKNVTFFRLGSKPKTKIEEMYFCKDTFVLDGMEYFIIRNPYTNGPMIARSDGEDIPNRKEICRQFLRHYGWNDVMFKNTVTNELERQIEKILNNSKEKIIFFSEPTINNKQKDSSKKDNKFNVTITNEMIEETHKAVKATDNYGKEDDLITECFKRFPNNTDVTIVAMKVGLIDITNSTHVSQHKSLISAVELAEYITKINII